MTELVRPDESLKTKSIFGGIKLTWPMVILGAIAAGVVTAVFAILPSLQYTSFHAMTVTFEAWIFFGIFIIMNSKSNLDSGLKCFVFFLISQPLIYLIQVPFAAMGWGLFGYYKYWFILTLFCMPMGFVGNYMKKDKWWGYLILLPMIVITANSYHTYLNYFLFYMPKFILVCIFCICGVIFYPVLIFRNKKIRMAGGIIGAAAVVVITVLVLLNPATYSTELMCNGDEYVFDDTYKVSLADEKYGDVAIIYLDAIEDHVVHADLKRAGETVLVLEDPDGERKEYDLVIEYDTYRITPR